MKKSQKYITVIDLGIVTLDSGGSLFNRQSELFVKAESWIKWSSSEMQGSLIWDKNMSEWPRDYPRDLGPFKADGGRGKECLPSFQPVGSL